MRDPDRIPELCQLLERVWTLNPDMRLGQLLVNAIRPSMSCPQIFSVEDSHTQRGLLELEAVLRRRGPAPELPPDLEICWQTLGAPAPSTVRLGAVREGSFEFSLPGAEGREAIPTSASVLELRFEGEYRCGSAGNPDAAAMRAAMLPWLYEREPDVVLFDLSGLSYRWGDGIFGLFQVIADLDGEDPVGVVVLAGPDSFVGLDGFAAQPFLDRELAFERARDLAHRRAVAIG